MDVASPVRTRTPTYYLDFELEPGASHSQLIPEGWTTFAYTLDGETTFEGGSTRCAIVIIMIGRRDNIQYRVRLQI